MRELRIGVPHPPPFIPLESFYSLGCARKIPFVSRVIGQGLSTGFSWICPCHALSRPIFSKALDYNGFSVEIYLIENDWVLGLSFCSQNRDSPQNPSRFQPPRQLKAWAMISARAMIVIHGQGVAQGDRTFNFSS